MKKGKCVLLKKALSCILIIAMFMAMSMPVFASADGPDFGTAPKTGQAITIDGIRDEIYDQGLKLNADKKLDATQADQGGGGTAWVLWDDEALYVFVEVNVLEYYDTGENADKAITAPWEIDDVEFLVDFTNAGERPIQYRLNLDAFPNVTLPDQDWLNGEDCRPYLDFAGKKEDLKYTCEYKIKFAPLISESVIANDIKAGKQIGVQIHVADCAADGSQTNYMLIDEVGPWATESFGWFTLGDNIVTIAVAEPEPEPEPVVNNEGAAVGGGGEENPHPTPAPVTSSPATGDNTVIFIIFAFALAVFAVTFKKAKVRN